MIDKIGGRKFVITVLVLLVVTVLFGIGKLSQEIFSNVLWAIVSIYVIGNVANKVVK